MPLEIPGHFPTSGAVPPADVVGRADAIEDIATRLRLGSNLIIAGPRRTGKSSVAGAVARRLEAGGGVVIETEFMFTTTLAAFVRAMFDASARAAAGQGDWWDQVVVAVKRAGLAASLKAKLGRIAEIGLSLAGSGEPERRLEEVLSLPSRLAERLGSRVVVLMDEFQDASKLHADFYRILRRYVADGGDVSYLFVGSRASLLRNLFVQNNEPLYRTAFEYELPDATRSEWRGYLERKLAEGKIEPTPGAVDAMLDRTGCHPQGTMMLAADVYAVLCRERRDRLTMDDIAEGGDRLLKSLILAFQAEWQDISKDRGARIALPRIASGEPVHGGLSRAESKATTDALGRLVRDGIVRRTDRGRYLLREALFAEWLRIAVSA